MKHSPLSITIIDATQNNSKWVVLHLRYTRGLHSLACNTKIMCCKLGNTARNMISLATHSQHRISCSFHPYFDSQQHNTLSTHIHPPMQHYHTPITPYNTLGKTATPPSFHQHTQPQKTWNTTTHQTQSHRAHAYNTQKH